MRDAVAKLWPEIEWIEDKKLRGQVAETWVKALERSPLKPDDLNRIPFTLLVAWCISRARALKPCSSSWGEPCQSTRTR